MNTTHVQISITGPGQGSVHVNGHRLTGVCGVEVHHSVKEYARVTVDLIVPTAEIDGHMTVLIPDRTTRDSLIQLGWTPPEDQ